MKRKPAMLSLGVMLLLGACAPAPLASLFAACPAGPVGTTLEAPDEPAKVALGPEPATSYDLAEPIGP